jgi:LmbE family N-acetylglucosaminyl deacetylase
VFLAEHCRFDRYDEIYVSPHLDDAVYSCAGRITQQRKAGLRILVVTLFGNGKDDQAAAIGGERVKQGPLGDYVWLNEPDFIFRRPSLGDLTRIAFPFLRLPASEMQLRLFSALSSLFEARLAPQGRVLFPFSVGFHPDHRIAFDVGRAVHAAARFDVVFYEDLPYAYAPVLRQLRLRYLGFGPTKTPLLRSAREMNFALFRFFGAPWLTLWPTLVYTLLLLAMQRLFGTQDRLSGEPAPVWEGAYPIDDVLDDKIAAMRLYPSQTALFLAMDDRLYEMLREPEGYVERRWVFPRFAQPSERLRKLGAGDQPM